jgi:2-amino-4-hydroxy-6-hydroxymethyldihydropteridine diphosphokinase
MHLVYLALGSNLGDRQAHLTAALISLSENIEIQAVSSIYETEPVGYVDQPQFFNIACYGYTSLSAQELLVTAKAIESQQGRQATIRNGPRVIDIDILMYDDQVLTQENLTIPHPRMRQRAFVLIPLAEIASAAHDPVSSHTINELLHHIEPDKITKVATDWFTLSPESSNKGSLPS